MFFVMCSLHLLSMCVVTVATVSGLNRSLRGPEPYLEETYLLLRAGDLHPEHPKDQVIVRPDSPHPRLTPSPRRQMSPPLSRPLSQTVRVCHSLL